MTSPSVVRLAGPDDHKEVWRLFLQAHKENGLFDLDENKVNYFMTRALNCHLIPPEDHGPRGVIGIIGEPEHLQALVFLMLGTYWYSSAMHIEEYLVYIDPRHRSSNNWRALVKWMKNQVEITGIPLLTGVISNHQTEEKCRLYRRSLPKIGEFFYLTPKGSTVGSLATAASS